MRISFFIFHMIHMVFLFSVSSDCRLSAVSAAAATPQKPVQFQFPELTFEYYSSVCETANRRILSSVRDFKNIYEFQLPVATGGLQPLQTHNLPAPFNSMSVGNREGTDRV